MRYVEDSLHLEGIVMPHVLECIVKTLKAIVVIPDEDIKRKDSRFQSDMGSVASQIVREIRPNKTNVDLVHEVSSEEMNRTIC